MSSDYEIKIDLCSPDDIPASFLALSKGFGHSAPFFDAYFPYHDTTSGQDSGIKRLLKMSMSDEETYFVKAVAKLVADGSEQIIGLALWTHMKEPPSDKLEDVENIEEIWTDKDDREYMRQLWKDYVVPRGEAVKGSGGKGIYVLELLGVDREYQRRGAGSALVLWGTERADRKGIDAIVEGTPEGLKCYHQGGFRTEIEEMKFNVGDKFNNRRKPLLAFLRRSAKR